MRVLIFRENGFAMAMSIIGVICGCMALVIGKYIPSDETMIIPTLVAAGLCFFFYFIGYRSNKKSAQKRIEEEMKYRMEHPEFFDKE